MKADAFLAAAERLPFATLHDITRGGGVVVVAPHPDDESLGCGGLIAEAVAQGVAVRLIVVSDGVGSHAGSKLYPPLRLRALREAETIAAADALGLDAGCVTFLRLPDTAVPTSGPEAERARAAIVAAAHDCAAGAVCVTWRHDPHCDHAAAAALVDGTREALGATAIFAYPIWGWTLPADTTVGEPPAGVRLDIALHVDSKKRAMEAHRSQTTDLIDDDPDGFRLEPAMLQRFARPFEIFLSTACEGHTS